MTLSTTSILAERLAALTAAAPDEATILAAFEDEAPPVRDRAIRLAARHMEPERLARLVADPATTSLRDSAIAALERQGPYAVPFLARLLDQTDDDELTLFTLQILGRIGDPAAAGAIRDRLHHQNQRVRRAAVEALGGVRAADSAPALLTMLDTEPGLQLAAIQALAEVADERAVPALLHLLFKEHIAEAAARALGRIAAPASLAPMLAALADARSPELRHALIVACSGVLARQPGLAASISASSRAVIVATVTPILEAAGRGEDAAPPEVVRAAAALAVAADLTRLWPIVLRLGADDTDAWLGPLCRRHAFTATPALRHFIGHADPSVRRTALLGGSFERSDATAIARRLNDPDPLTQAAAAVALGRLPGEALGDLGGLLREQTEEGLLLHALEALRRARSPLFEERVLRWTQASASAVRCAALRVVAGWEGARADAALLHALGDRSEDVQAEVVELLVQRGGGRAVQTLIALLSTADSLRFRVIRALGRLRATSAATRLQVLYPDCPMHERLEIVEALARIATPRAKPFLIERLGERDPDFRAAAARGLAALVAVEDLPRLERLADDSSWPVRQAAAEALAQLPVDAARPLLLQLGRDVEPAVARAAREGLARAEAVRTPIA